MYVAAFAVMEAAIRWGPWPWQTLVAGIVVLTAIMVKWINA